MGIILTDEFPLALEMINNFPVKLLVDKINNIPELCERIHDAMENNTFVNALRHESTVSLINQLCGLQLKASNIRVDAGINDIILLTVFKPDDSDKTYQKHEIEMLYHEGKLKLYRICYEKLLYVSVF